MTILRKQGRCFGCLRTNHMIRECRSTKKCSICGRRHHISVCRGSKDYTKESKHNAISQKNPDDVVDETQKSDKGASEVTSNKNQETKQMFTPVERGSILLQTASVRAFSGNRSCQLRLLFDSGSQRTFISLKAAEKLKCDVISNENISVSTFGTERWNNRLMNIVSLYLVADSGDYTEIHALVTDIITAPLKIRVQQNWNEFKCLKDLKLADEINDGSVLDIDVIIGNDYYGELVTGEVLKGAGPIAMNSKFGWLISGPACKAKGSEGVTCLKVRAVSMDARLD